MRLSVFGATGRLGQEVVRLASQRGHEVIAHARSPVGPSRQGAVWMSGDIAPVVQGSAGVIVTFGPRSPSDPPFCEAQTQLILSAMLQQGVSRILCVTGAMVGHYSRNRTWLFEHLATWIQRRYLKTMDDRTRQETLVRNSDLRWTIFKPPRLTMKQATGRCEVGSDVRVGLLSSISRDDLAGLLVEEIERNNMVGQTVFVKGIHSGQAPKLAAR